ncbi:MAG: DUF4398 domain-containing protein [Acidobacteria bacterium]|jgi:hypothetical protein|nr:DUF4398 domain-containing protein [Acidobacteriota bacterium]MCZ6745629.1 DUF4398 domain-containing protein [Acidobacteriota bacterium]
MRKRIPVLAALAAILVLTAACAEPPEETVLQAEQDLQGARDAEAATYAAEELRDARLALEEAQQEIQAQNERFAIMRDYEEAEKKLAGSMDKARLARETAVERKEEARQAAVESLEFARQAIEEANTALAEAPRGKGTKADISALTADLDGVRSQVPALEAQIDEEDYFAARDKAASMTESAQAIAEEIKAAVEIEARILAKRRNR